MQTDIDTHLRKSENAISNYCFVWIEAKRLELTSHPLFTYSRDDCSPGLTEQGIPLFGLHFGAIWRHQGHGRPEWATDMMALSGDQTNHRTGYRARDRSG